jgi:IS605 OrfB family transposase
MEVRRTVPVTLDVDSDDAALLENTVDTFLWDETYDEVREATDGFNGGLVQAARNKAAEACKSVVARWEQGKKASKPQMTSPHVVYDHRTATFHDEYVSLATVDGRIEADYVLPDQDSDTTGAELHRKHGEWQLHIHCKREVESDTPEQAPSENGTVLGVDLGVNNLAVTSTGTFWTGDEFDHWRKEYETRRGDLQACGTRWAHENMQAVGRKEEGRFKQTLHRISNEIVAEARENSCSVIAFEELTDIRERTGGSWGHKWAFNRLYDYVEYKAAEYGIAVEQVNPFDVWIHAPRQPRE